MKCGNFIYIYIKFGLYIHKMKCGLYVDAFVHWNSN